MIASKMIEFRYDINGLRAWAVAAVILYHFGASGFHGGFIGVDIFFVISGFLMSTIIIEALGKAEFSLWQFYLARAKRIIPALLVFCLTLLIAGWFLLPAPDYLELGEETTYALTFISNILFWRQKGYFDAAAHDKWLLHTWSLSVEWQFYMLFPILLMIVWKLRPNRNILVPTILVSFISSLILSLLISPKNPTPAFYLFPTRAWELLSGSMIYLFAYNMQLGKTTKRLLELFGFCLIIASILWFDKNSNWPGWRALFPVTGAVLVLIAARSDSFITNNPIAQWLGNCSYSLYLWHWFVVVSLAYLELPQDNMNIFVGITITCFLAQLSYSFVEQPARICLGELKYRTAITLVALTCLAIITYGSGIWINKGWPQRFSENKLIDIAVNGSNDNSIRLKNSNGVDCLPTSGVESPSCMLGGEHLRAILVGDSHSAAMAPALVAALPNKNDGVLEWSYTTCPTLFGAHRTDGTTPDKNHDCFGFNNWVHSKIKDINPDIPLVIVNSATYDPFSLYFGDRTTPSETDFMNDYANSLIETSCEFAKNRTVYLVRPIPNMPFNVPKKLSRRALWGIKEDVSVSLEEYHHQIGYIWDAQNTARDRCGVKILDPIPYLCTNDRCFASRDSRPLYIDDSHVNAYGNQILTPMFKVVVN